MRKMHFSPAIVHLLFLFVFSPIIALGNQLGLTECKHLVDLTGPALCSDRNAFVEYLSHEGEGSNPKVAGWLSKPLLTDDGRIYACSGKNLFSFDNNGTVVWIVPLSYLCNVEISPVVDDRGKIYLIAEDRVLKITPMSTSEVFFGPNSSIGGSGEIIGLSISILYSSIFVTVKTRALFAFSLHGELLWSAGPVLYRFGYRQGCKENLRDCYFNSAPVVDQCEGTLYISNTEGQLYSLYMRNRNFRWVHDFASIDKLMTIIPGNNGLVYVIFPNKASVIALDVRTGNTSWQQNFGPLSSEQSLPVVDSNGWLSISSLDGYLYSFSPTGEVKKLLHATASDAVIQASPVLDCSGFSVYVLQTKMTVKSSLDIENYTHISAMNPASIVLTLLTPATGTVYWTANYPGELAKLFANSDLRYFKLDERIFLTFLSSARIGYTLPCHTMSQKVAWTCSQANPKFVNMYAGNEGTILPFIFFQLAVLILLACCVRFCFIFWRKKKLQDYGLVRFLDRRRTLRHKKKALGRIISELEQKAAEDIDSCEVLEQLGEMVKAKEEIERKLSTSYSLGRDTNSSNRGYASPVSDGNMKSHSFHSARMESVTIFNSLSSTESGGGSSISSSDTSSGSEDSWQSWAKEPVGKGKSVIEERSPEASSEGSPELTSSTGECENPMFAKRWTAGWGSEGVSRRKMWEKKTLARSY